jgi:hypothetical protein
MAATENPVRNLPSRDAPKEAWLYEKQLTARWSATSAPIAASSHLEGSASARLEKTGLELCTRWFMTT